MQFFTFVYFNLILDLRCVLSRQISGLREQRHCPYISSSDILVSSSDILLPILAIVLPHPRCSIETKTIDTSPINSSDPFFKNKELELLIEHSNNAFYTSMRFEQTSLNSPCPIVFR